MSVQHGLTYMAYHYIYI
uniref:Uncharacterized protein n=1 Tax=Anguilla anguilla TaxID=7936 RepID=A0A0E9SFZ0_ANGAN